MKLLRNQTIVKKLSLIAMSSVVIAVLLTGIASLLMTWQMHQRIAIENISALGQVIAENCIIPLTFNISDDATDVLATLKTRKTIMAAYLYDDQGALFAKYQRKNQASSVIMKSAAAVGVIHTGGVIQVTIPVLYMNEHIGLLTIHDDLTEMIATVQEVSIAILGVMFLSLAIAYFIASRLQNMIINPVTELARIAQLISSEKGYAIRAQKYAEDEIGQLTDAFNKMLNQIQKRDDSLQESEARQRIITEQAPEAIVIFDTDKDMLVYANENAVQLFDLSQEQLSNRLPYQLSPEFQANGQPSKLAFQKYLDIALQGGSPIFEWQHINAKNQEIACEVRLVRLPQSGYNLVRASVMDISERKRAEKELQQLRNYLKSIVDSMPSVLVGVDTQGKVTQWNKEAERVTGIKAENAEGYNLADVYPQIKAGMEQVRQAISLRQPLVHHKIATQGKDQTIYNDITVFPLIADGIEGAVVRVDNITEQVRIEEMMVQSEKLLSVGGLAAGMAHELNNPLAGMIQNLQVIKNRLATDLPKNFQIAEQCGTSMALIERYMQERRIFEIMALIMDSGFRASKIITNMLSFSRKSSGQKETACVLKLLDKALELAATDHGLSKNFDFRQIEIFRDYATSELFVDCEPNQIQQVFLNIFKNGAQAMAEQNDGTVKRFILRTSVQDQWITIEIEDNGPGMDENTRKRVFEPFFTTKEAGIGTGLGLSVSYFIITENHHGHLAVESAPSKGARFVIKLQSELF